MEIAAIEPRVWAVGEYLRTRRVAKGLSGAEIEEAVQLLDRQLSAPLADLESGSAVITMADGRAISRAMGVDFGIVMAIGIKGVAEVCRECGCSWKDACATVCAWADDSHTICSSCHAREEA